MNMIFDSHSLRAFGLLLALSNANATLSFAESDDRAVAHVLVVADTNDSRIGTHVLTDRVAVESVFKEGLPSEAVRIRILEGEHATPENVIAYYRDLKVGSIDTVIFYYAGHGAVDDKLGHVLTMQTGNLSRRTLVKMISEKKPRLSIIATDCCSIFGEIPVAYALGPAHPETLRYLLFRHRGTVDLNAAEIGHPAYGNQYGGVFTFALLGVFRLAPKLIDTDGDSIPSWSEVWERVRDGVQLNSKELLARDLRLRKAPASIPPSQVPHLFSELPSHEGQVLAVPADGVGLVVIDGPAGVEVQSVVKDSLAEWFGFQVGDRVLEVDGRPIRSREAYLELMRNRRLEWPDPVNYLIARQGKGELKVTFLPATPPRK